MNESIIIKNNLHLKISGINLSDSKEICLIELKGYLDTYNSSDFQKTIINKIIHTKAKYIIFNCRELQYISSMGVGIFTFFNNHFFKERGLMVLCHLQEKCYHIFQQLGFTNFFHVKNTMEDAEKYMKKTISHEIERLS